MKTLQVKAASRNYTVTIGKDLRFRLTDFLEMDYSKILVVTDDIVAPLYLADVLQGLPESLTYTYTIPSGEASKSIEEYYKLQTVLMEHHFDRNGLIIALGGGVVGDLAGFAAATYMRGIDYIQVPTTILAHDSSVGGKVAINHELGKNMIGSFYPPAAVVYDVGTLTSLPLAQIRSGYAELVKEAFISDPEFLWELLQLELIEVKVEDLIRHLYKGIQIKAHIVEADERETRVRKYLNFGHTLAHALETELGYGALTHGEAVAVGMLFAIQLSNDVHQADLPAAMYQDWLRKNVFPLNIKSDIAALVKHMKHDKKAHGEMLQFILLKQAGQPVIQDMQAETVYEALKAFIKELNNQ